MNDLIYLRWISKLEELKSKRHTLALEAQPLHTTETKEADQRLAEILREMDDIARQEEIIFNLSPAQAAEEGLI